ncbi:MAG: BhlA/UviB family holin-like peptide [Bacillota bacterium]
MEGIDLMKYFVTQGPFAVLFIWLLLRSEKRNETREGQYRDEIKHMRGEMKTERNEWRKERSVWSETLQKFSDKYDVVIDELRDIKNKIGGGK